MTTYSIPAEAEGPVWLTAYADATVPAAPIRYYRVDGPAGPRWCNAAADELTWVELLALGEVEDEYPGEYDLHGTATPWELGTDRTVVDATGEEVFYVSGTATSTGEDVELAKLIVDLVNGRACRANLATHAAPAAVVEDQADEDDPRSYKRTVEGRLALAVNELVLYVRGLPTAALTNLGRGWPELAKHVNAVGNAHDAVNR